MYSSGRWRGFWQQPGFGQQPMEDFDLVFDGTAIRGQGWDIVGLFTIKGTWEPSTGRITFRKHYLGRHTVEYEGEPDGEGRILGRWSIQGFLSGPFLLQPAVPGNVSDLPINDLGR